jgi:hypothetical protein
MLQNSKTKVKVVYTFLCKVFSSNKVQVIIANLNQAVRSTSFGTEEQGTN